MKSLRRSSIRCGKGVQSPPPGDTSVGCLAMGSQQNSVMGHSVLPCHVARQSPWVSPMGWVRSLLVGRKLRISTVLRASAVGPGRPVVHGTLGSISAHSLNWHNLVAVHLFSAVVVHLPRFEQLGIDIKVGGPRGRGERRVKNACGFVLYEVFQLSW